MKTVQYGLMLLLVSVVNLTGRRVVADTFGDAGNQFTIEFTTVGNPGNPPNLFGARPTGSVPYVFRMGQHEISRAMVDMATTAGHLGITLDPMTYVPAGPRPNMPATHVSWNEAARFVNWMNASHGFSPAYKFATQPGQAGYDANENILLWEPGDGGYDAGNPFRNRSARYFLPSEDEWYKAAYYDPNANNGNGRYWNYATGSDAPPRRVASGTAAGTAVYGQPDWRGPADVTQAGGLSPYGVMGMGGNVFEWQETGFDLANDNAAARRGIRGGGYAYTDYMTSAFRIAETPEFQSGDYLGFRVASAIEPSATGDYDYDGDTDGNDFLAWQQGLSPDPLSAEDLAAWKQHFGPPGTVGAVATVPEPASLSLLGIVCAVGLGGARTRRQSARQRSQPAPAPALARQVERG